MPSPPTFTVVLEHHLQLPDGVANLEGGAKLRQKGANDGKVGVVFHFLFGRRRRCGQQVHVDGIVVFAALNLCSGRLRLGRLR